MSKPLSNFNYESFSSCKITTDIVEVDIAVDARCKNEVPCIFQLNLLSIIGPEAATRCAL